MKRIAILTTNTTHHRYFVSKVLSFSPLSLIVVETDPLKAPFETDHPYEKSRDQYERDYWGKDADTPMSHFAEVLEAPRINNLKVKETLERLNLDLIIDFGTSRVSPEILSLPSFGTWNLHGGDPEQYRGLDSHLWAIYRGDFAALITTLHKMDAQLDTGEIILRRSVPVIKNMDLSQLRARNTENCATLVETAIGVLTKTGSVPAAKQHKKGDYYSFMPTELKGICVERFQKHTDALP